MSLSDDSKLPSMDELTLSDTEAMKKTSVDDMDLHEVEHLRAKLDRFRVLIFGRANAGKTSILAQICRSTKDKAIRTRGGKRVSLFSSNAF
jgi:GTPase SAR1 family protein